MIGSNNRISLQKDQMSNKTRFFSMQAFLKNQKFNYTVSSFLIFMFILVLGFQNCGKTKNEGGPIDKVSASVGDKAIFKLSEKYGGNKTISHILWRVNGITGTEENIKIDWSEFLIEVEGGESYLKYIDYIDLEAFIQFEGDECVTYRKQGFVLTDIGISSVSTSQLGLSDTLSITSTLSPNKDINYQRYFPVGSSVNLGLNIVSHNPFNVRFDTFQWSIKKLFLEDDTELADQTNKTANPFTHTFSQTGLYNIFVQASGTRTDIVDESSDVSVDLSTKLLIGICEDTSEIILSGESFGSSTPQLSDIQPIFNYVRPADTDTNNKVTFVFDGNSENYQDRHVIYKYKRNSSSKFIDIDIQNADTCFLDTEPLSTTECIPSTCSSDAADCNCHTFYEIREDLSSLSSCSGNALDMSALDTDTTQCTDAVFIVAASKAGQENKVESYRYYKHCPADQDYCYFGEEHDRPSDHQCPSS